MYKLTSRIFTGLTIATIMSGGVLALAILVAILVI